MSISTISNSITRIQKEIADLHHKMSVETKKEVDCNNKIGQIERSITKNTSLSTLNSKNSEIQRKQSEISKIQIKKADLHKKISDKDGKLLKLKQDLTKEEEKERKKQIANEEKERKKLLDLEKRTQREQLAFQRQLQREIQNTNNMSVEIEIENSNTAINQSMLSTDYDLFISHASEDKEEIVRPLAEELQKLGVKVWYDEFTLKVGDSLRKSIDHGLLKSKYGTVILSSTFCSKSWTQYEFDSMVTREMNGHKMILPIWHKVTKNDVINFSPALADKVALNTSLNSIEEIAKQLSEVILDE